MLRQVNMELQVNTVGEPDIESRSEEEQETFFSTILAHIKALKEQASKDH